MSATLGDPVLLATYSLPSASRKGKEKEVAEDERPLVFASFSSVPARDDEQVTLAVQGDGVYVYELGDLHPVSSRSFGPSTSFASAPASVVYTEDETNVRRIYIAAWSAQELRKEDSCRVIWTWKESASGDTSSSRDKQSTQLLHGVAFLLASSELSSIIAVSRAGSLTRMDVELNAKNTWSPKHAQQEIMKLFLFPTRECIFIPPTASSNGCTLILFAEHDKKLFVQTLVLRPEGEVSALDPLEVPLGDVDDVIDVSLECTGNMSVLGSNGIWTPYLLEMDGVSITISASPPLRLKSLDFISEKKHRSPSVSLLSLGSSFVLLASTTLKEIALLLWDIQYGVLLHSTILPIPSTLDSPPNGISIQLERGSGSQALLILSPISANPKNNTQQRSSVLVVPFSVPERSTIASALGKADLGAKWLGTASSRQEGEDVFGAEIMLTQLKEAIDNNRIKEGDGIFFNWISERDEKMKRPDTDKNEPEDVGMTEVVLRPEESPNKQYSPQICRYLVTKHLASHSMVKGGLLDALLQRNDWETIRECFLNVVDLPETELLRLLCIIVKHHRDRPVEGKGAVTSDKPRKMRARDEHWHEIPSVKRFLACLVDYPATQAAWRTGLRQHFADIDDLMTLLAILDEWMDAYATKGLPVGLGKTSLNEHGVPVPDPQSADKPLRLKGVTLPSLENLLTFVQAILDSSFLNLLQNRACHQFLRRISENITEIHSSNLELQSLRGPLEPFVRAQNRAIAEVANGGKKQFNYDDRLEPQEPGVLTFPPLASNHGVKLRNGKVSDTASKDTSADKSGPVLKELVSGRGFQVNGSLIVPDDEKTISEAVVRWSASGDVDWIITTGGTGFGVRDRTPEAIQPLLDRKAPGIVHLLISASLAHTPLAALSRPIAGTVRGSHTLVTTLPGSVKAVRENLTALLGEGTSGLGVIGHALELLRGGSGTEVHSALARGVNPVPPTQHGLTGHPHEHQCGHHHNKEQSHNHSDFSTSDPSSSVATRHRTSPFPLISYEAALEAIFRHVQQMEVVKVPVTAALKETVLAEDVYAPQDVPPAPTTNMDGYAVRSSDAPGVYQVLTPQTHALSTPLPKGFIYRINTGAPLPVGTDSIVIVEDTQLVSLAPENEEKEVRTLVQAKSGENVRAPGSDVKKGALVLTEGHVISGTGGEIGTLAFVSVHRKPVIAIMSTGSELVDVQGSSSSEPQVSGENWTGIWDTNRPSLQAALETMGYHVIDLGIVQDNLKAHVETLKGGLEKADLILTTGGTSMGASDLLKPVIEQHLNGTIHFGRVTIKPGKPTTFATVPAENDGQKRSKTIFALPGNPASALVCFYIFVVPALRKLGGWSKSKCQLPRVRVELTDTMQLDARTEFHRVVISAGSNGLKARSTGGQRSSRVASLSGANGLVILPQKKEGGGPELKAGELAEAILIGEIVTE
ncbi:hypothetical protein A7U60_g5433 [Sanghuangporus baumii]|uniref:MoaB/Mog domain-containing protein n=1 Tax=Sanghuangporus baumii TaxID=108892 RepID=A0A9Q5N8D1_SANBA|nr:hypothetical protein A7U60_g5433 [Sanghuangporus baumii]